MKRKVFTNVFISLFLLLEFVFCEFFFVNNVFDFFCEENSAGQLEYFCSFTPWEIIPSIIIVLLTFAFCYCRKIIIRKIIILLLFPLNFYVLCGFYFDLTALFSALFCILVMVLSFMTIKKNQEGNCIHIFFVTMLIYFYGSIVNFYINYQELLFAGSFVRNLFSLIFSILIIFGLLADLFLDKCILRKWIIKVCVIGFIILYSISTGGKEVITQHKKFFDYFYKFFMLKEKFGERGISQSLVTFLSYIGSIYYCISLFMEKRKLNIT